MSVDQHLNLRSNGLAYGHSDFGPQLLAVGRDPAVQVEGMFLSHLKERVHLESILPGFDRLERRCCILLRSFAVVEPTVRIESYVFPEPPTEQVVDGFAERLCP
jgi:hypothetical protein